MSDTRFVVGDRVEYVDDDGDVYVGEINSLFAKKEDGETVAFAIVKWDGNDEEEEWEVELLEPEGDENELEAEFKKACEDHLQEIEDQLKIASDAIAKAEELSEKYGIPFESGVSPLGQSFTPQSFWSKFRGLDTDAASDISGAYPGGEYGEAGWEHSAVC